jgi:Holliday junction DNA helicase RuvA
LEQVIAGEDVKALKNVKGIGGKTAERIIVDLRDKIKPEGDTLSIKVSAVNDAYDEAMAALVMLGYTRQQSQKALKKLFDAEPTLKVESAIKKALALM